VRYKLIFSLLQILLCFLCFGCASVSVLRENVAKRQAPKQPPAHIYVQDFSLESSEINVDREGEELASFQKSLQNYFADALVERLSKHIAPATRIADRKDIPAQGRSNAWLVTGNFTRINQGSRALRTFIGLGLGGTKFEASVKIYRLTNSGQIPFYQFDTSGGSNAEPGIIVGVWPDAAITAGSATLSVALLIGHGISEDAVRTTRMIVAAISDYLHDRNLFDDEPHLIPKRPMDPPSKENSSPSERARARGR
jgi:hypothetical protein